VRYVGGIDEQGRDIDVRDPLASQLRTRLDAAGDEPEARIRAILAVQEVFGADLPGDPRFLHALVAAYRNLLMRGARGAAAAVATGT
jgi:fructuronate reductase